MIAYFVHDSRKQIDTIVLPEKKCTLSVNTERIKMFISAQPDFSQWSGDSCNNLSPEVFGTIVATRDECGDVAVIRKALWQERLEFHLQGT
ncbi:MAG: hypothetical protein PVI90_05250 [Desulfobacteraceae bacterium]|jgi:hypothetical protein